MTQHSKEVAAPPSDIVFRLAADQDQAAIESLTAEAFGPGRFARAAYRLREGNVTVDTLCFVAERAAALVGSVTFSPVVIGETPALLLGPLTVTPALKNLGIGVELMRLGLAAAKTEGHRLVILVGDAPYYARVGFEVVPPGQVHMPGPVDPNRLLVAALAEGAAEGLAGSVRAAPAFTPHG